MYPQDRPGEWHSGQGLWQGVDPTLWNDWGWQMRNRLKTAADLERLMELSPSEKEGCRHAGSRLALSITPHFFNLIDRDDPGCPIRRQVIPRADEMETSPEERIDPLGEEHHMAAPGLVHRYPDRVLFLVTDRCASYCRYCTRSRLVSNARGYQFHPEYEEARLYIRRHTGVRDVLLSGGDPLLLSDEKLGWLLSELRSIEHVEFIRIGSRVPVFMPQRVTPALCEILKKHGPVWMSIHTNHPRACTVELKEACEKLSYAGVPLGNQSVLLKGVNDDPETMKSLVHRLLMMRVRPYYLYMGDLVQGTAHLRGSLEKGVAIIRSLRGHTSGYAVPQLVIDAPGGGGKIPINPDYVEELGDNRIVLRNFQGRKYAYPLGEGIPTEAAETAGSCERCAGGTACDCGAEG